MSIYARIEIQHSTMCRPRRRPWSAPASIRIRYGKVLKQYAGHHSSCADCYRVWTQVDHLAELDKQG